VCWQRTSAGQHTHTHEATASCAQAMPCKLRDYTNVCKGCSSIAKAPCRCHGHLQLAAWLLDPCVLFELATQSLEPHTPSA
jgi:hypothetical protein